MNYTKNVERWGLFEAEIAGPSSGNPFTEQKIAGEFSGKNEKLTVDGFYDGNGVYKVRFMPSFEGEYSFKISASFLEGEETGSFVVSAPKEDNHGPVHVNGCHFAYADGTPHFSVGTTCYVWELQSQELQEKTLETLSKGYFNKIRFCIFPKHYLYNLNEPSSYPYEGTACKAPEIITGDFSRLMGVQPGNDWDFTRFNPEHFRHIEESIIKLDEMGIEADIIVMHPYDRWGFSHMNKEQDDLYWNYVIARLSAYKNVWWSLANEFDLLQDKTTEDWERYADIICEKDKYNRLRSIHNCRGMYDHTRPWITHCSIQRVDVYKCAELVDEYRLKYNKPIVLDEIAYEGNIDQGWGNISGKELVRRFWEATVRGGYAGHGETYVHPDDILWWSHGGELHGESQDRIKFLYDEVLKKLPGPGLRRSQGMWDEVCAELDTSVPRDDYYLIYFGFFRPSSRKMSFGEKSYKVEIIDTWNMTIEDAGVFTGNVEIPLYGREYIAIRLIKV